MYVLPGVCARLSDARQCIENAQQHGVYPMRRMCTCLSAWRAAHGHARKSEACLRSVYRSQIRMPAGMVVHPFPINMNRAHSAVLRRFQALSELLAVARQAETVHRTSSLRHWVQSEKKCNASGIFAMDNGAQMRYTVIESKQPRRFLP